MQPADPSPCSGPDAPGVSVVIPVYNGRGHIAGVLDSLRLQDFGPDRFETIVVDDGSTDGTAELVRRGYPEVRLVAITNGGSYAARNAGLALARGRVIAFTDADCRPAPGWLRSGVEAIERGSADLVAGAVATEVRNPRSVIEFYDQSFGINQPFYVQHLGFGATANLFVRREWVQRIGGFDAKLRSGGDQKFCKTATAGGARLSYCEAALVRHEVRSSAIANFRKITRVARGVAQITPRRKSLEFSTLSDAPAGFFDHERFLATRDGWFRLRFRCFYYAMAACWLLAYARQRMTGRNGTGH